ncbi:MAG: hypothetical protein QOE06_2560 [Thermoleophilaceae bacterium]|nr:hypothetical protein [Thermoleophilaceae bacterium]
MSCVVLSGSDSPDPTVSNNAFGSAGKATVALETAVALDKLGGNTFSGAAGFGAVVFDGAHIDHSGAFPATGSAILGVESGSSSSPSYCFARFTFSQPLTVSLWSTVARSLFPEPQSTFSFFPLRAEIESLPEAPE